MTTIRSTLAGLCLVAALVAGCSQSSTTTEETTDTATATTEVTETTEATTTEVTGATETTGAPDAEAATITIEGMSFGEPITVAPGAQITVKNQDSAEHSVTSRTEGQFDVHVDGGQQGTLTAPTEPGEYEFFCVYHPNMTGTLIVA